MFTQNVMASIVMLLAAAYIIGVVVFISLMAEDIISKMYVGQEILTVFTGFMFYYFIYDLLLRFLFQEIPTLSIKPYLTQAIKKSSLLHYILKGSLLSVFNILGIVLILPFFIKSIWPNYDLALSLAWLLSLLALIVVNNYLTVWLKNTFTQRPLLIIGLLALFVLTTVLEYFGQLPLSVKFSNLIVSIIQQQVYVLIPLSLAALAYFIAYTKLRSNAYIEDVSKKQGKTFQFAFLNQYGELGNLLALEFKLMTRNKRPRSLLILSCVFLLYGFMFYQGSNMDNYYMLLLAGTFLTCMFPMSYGQLLFSWESCYFDLLNTHNISMRKYVESKYILLSGASVITYLLTLPYALIDSKIAFINTALIIYNVGFTNILVIAIAAFNTSKIDLGRSQMMNTQGMGALQFLKTIPIIGIPALIIFLFSLLGHPEWAFITLAIIGAMSLIFKNYLLSKVADLLQNRKYKMLVGFRKG